MSEETGMIMEQLKQMNETMAEIKENINVLKSASEINDMRMEWLLRNQSSLKQNMYDILIMGADKVRLELKMIDIESGIKRLESLVQRVEWE